MKAVFISDDGRVLRTLNIFPAERPGCRYLFPTCTIAAGSVLVSAVKVEDVTGDHGVIDQYHTIATALVSSSDGEVRVTGYPARLDHGLLVDIERGIPAKGYLGLRRQPRLLRGGFLYWERREAPDTAAPVTAGVLCCSEFRSQTGDWGPERVLYRGGLSYRAARDGGGGLWIAFREIEQGHGHRLRVDHLDPEAEPSAPGQTVSWAEPRHWQPADLPVRMASVRPCRTVESRTAGGRTAGSRSAGRSTPHSQATGETTEFLYWGDPHVHSALSIDVEGEPDEMLHYARDLAKLDFVALVENDDLFTCRLTAAERFRGDELAEAWTKNGLFVVLSGFEYTWQVAYGLDRNPRTVLLPARGGRMIRWSDPRQDGGEGRAGDYGTPSGLKLLAERLDALLITQHQKWELADTDREVGIEAVSGWYTYMHNPFYAHAAWASGRRLGLYGTSDGHRRVAGLAGGLTGVWAEELSPAGIMSSMRKHRTFATQGRRPEIRLELSDERGTSLFLGDYGKLTGAITARILVRTEGADDTEAYDDRLVLVELKHGDRVLYNWEASDFTDNGRSCVVEQRLPPLHPESHLYQTDLLKPYYVYLRVRLAGPDREYTYNAAAARGPWAWSSPIWWDWEE